MLSDGIEFQCTWEFPTLSLRETKSSGSELRFLATSGVGKWVVCLLEKGRGGPGGLAWCFDPWVFHTGGSWGGSNLREGSWSFRCWKLVIQQPLFVGFFSVRVFGPTLVTFFWLPALRRNHISLTMMRSLLWVRLTMHHGVKNSASQWNQWKTWGF